MAGLVVAEHLHDTVPHPPPERPRRFGRVRTTPGTVLACVAAAVLLACALGITIAAEFGGARAGFTAIGGHDAPLADESTGLYFSVNDMDAQVANVLLTGDDPALAADRQQDLSIYGQDRRRAEQDLQQVTVTAAADPAAQRAVGSVLDALSRYEALAADAILVNQRGKDPAGRPSAATLGYYQQATDLMQSGLLPAAASLTGSNANALDAAYAQHESGARDGGRIVAGSGLAVAGLLVVIQVYLAKRYRRMLNPALGAATLLTAGLAITAAARLDAQAGHFTVAKQDAFGSIIALTQARAVSYDANADESRWLVDPGRAARYQAAFLAKSQQLAAMGNVGIDGYDAALAAGIGAYQASHADVRFGGFLGAEFRNITFPGERAAATQALLAYQVYERDDRRLRAIAAANLDQAIAFDVGTARGQSDWAFSNWDTALGRVIAINQDAFTAAINAGDGTSGGWDGPIPVAAGAVIAVIIILGSWRRLTEYR